ncbi:class A sortase [Enterococcus hulanensis]|uniref:class A sortase n=1 Tax=Enterococcus TaxID=1350 RepID=UPI000B5A630E|nr:MULTISPECIES: class A sortase [Enterococcus]MBO0409912.1 class A sortase [Enterococcus hulanensis]OTO21200.1 hypothetical protein A5875_002572 [Enterococcus sp. 3H8_DIV0648]
MKKRKNEKQNRLVKIVVLFLLYTGVLLVSFPILKNSILVEKVTTSKITEVKNLTEITQIPFERIEAPSVSEIMKSSNDFSSIGEVQVPGVGLDLPVFAGLSQEEMIYGAGSMYPKRNPQKDNLVLLGHHLGVSDLLFGKLKDAQLGDTIYLRYLSNYYAYKIQSKEIVNEADIAVLENTAKPLLTLVTCDRGTQTTGRLVITAKLVEAQAKDSIQTKMTKQEKVSHGQKPRLRLSMIWLPLLGIGLLLVLLTYLIIKKV